MVAIKDFGMPTCCANCDLCINGQYEELTCVLLGEEWEETDYNSDHRDVKCPLVEIEPLTDTEQCIFLSAISREEQVCGKIDNDKVDDGTVKKLVPVVNSIERKVKKALWE